MNLQDTRNMWHNAMKNGVWHSIELDSYRKYRNTEDWRSSRVVEQLCEYILFLEEQLEQHNKPD